MGSKKGETKSIVQAAIDSGLVDLDLKTADLVKLAAEFERAGGDGFFLAWSNYVLVGKDCPRGSSSVIAVASDQES